MLNKNANTFKHAVQIAKKCVELVRLELELQLSDTTTFRHMQGRTDHTPDASLVYLEDHGT